MNIIFYKRIRSLILLNVYILLFKTYPYRLFVIRVLIIIFMKRIAKRLLPERAFYFISRLKDSVKRKYRKSYGQSGEDMILSNIFFDKKIGFYVDVGANNPCIQSNTHFFYKKGWRGINIDALPGSMKQ